MMQSKSKILLIFLLAFSGLSAQENDIKDQILSYKESEYDFVNKGRRLLLDNLREFKTQEAINVKNGLLKEFEGNVANVFYNGEYIHLLYWTNEFYELLNYLKQIDSNLPVSNNVRVSAQTDNFFKEVSTHTVENRDVLEIDVKNADLNEMDRAFLLLLLEYIANPTSRYERANSVQVTKINEMADQFLGLYPDSPYDKIVREQLRWSFKESEWGLYWDVGLGAALHQGDISRQFSNGMGLGLQFEYRYRKLMGMFGFDVVSQTLKQDLSVNNTVWKKGAAGTLSAIYLNAGHLVFENQRWSIYPYAGIGYTGYSAADKETKEDKNLNKLQLNSFFTQVGVGIDLKIISGTPPDSYPRTMDSRISLRYSYRMPRFERKDPLLSGSQHVITLSYGFGGRPKVRDL